MQAAKWILVAMACASGGAMAQQPATSRPTAPAQPVTYKPVQPDSGPVQACPTRFEFHPELDGVYQAGGNVKAPKIKDYFSAPYSNEAKTRGAFNPFKPSTSLISFVVDAAGTTHDLCIMRHAGFGLDEQAAIAVRQYRFQPAKKEGVPVAVRISLEVDFKN